MDTVANMELFATVVFTAFAFAFGACAGSLVNVLAYRMPLGLSVVSPPSRCPACHTMLTWRENIPIFGWLFLRGRCRFCRSPISPEYPIVEFIVAALWALLFYLWFCLPPTNVWTLHQHAWFLGIDWSTIKPHWAWGGFAHGWPLYVMTVVLVSCLVAMTICDAKTFMIPITLCWVPGILGIIVHTGYAAYLQATKATLVHLEPGWTWALPSPAASSGGSGWWMVGAAIGATVGLGIANILLSYGFIRRSFADYPEWEKAAYPQPKPWACPAANCCPLPQPEPSPKLTGESADATRQAEHDAARRKEDQSPAEMWLMYPHARREMMKELVFLAPVLALGMLGGWIAMKQWGGPAPGVFAASPSAFIPAFHPIPMWLDALTGSLWGMLVGGGVVWAIRIFGSLAFGKEAMGLGDAHMMAGVGACMGWIDATLAFFLATFVGLFLTGVAALSRGKASRSLPLGPSLAIATLLVLFGKTGIEHAIGWIMPVLKPVHLP